MPRTRFHPADREAVSRRFRAVVHRVEKQMSEESKPVSQAPRPAETGWRRSKQEAASRRPKPKK